MSINLDSVGEADIRVAEVIWTKSPEGSHQAQQQRHLIELVDAAGTGVILDCSLVEIGNSEIISLLMRVRNHAKKMGKEIALFNVPETLSYIIGLCNLRSVLPASSDATEASKLVRNLSRGKGHGRLWLVSHKRQVISAAAALLILIVIVGVVMIVF